MGIALSHHVAPDDVQLPTRQRVELACEPFRSEGFIAY